MKYSGVLLASILILLQFSQAQTLFDVFAEDAGLPDWILQIFEFWYNGEITDEEFINAMKWYRDLNTVQHAIELDDTKTNFLITPMPEQKELGLTRQSNCSSDWYITGYFTPIESDYSGNFERIAFGDYIKHFKSDFLADVKIEGWGKTTLGDYVGWYDNSFHLSDSPLDMHGDELQITSVAVDSTLIKQKTKLSIPTLPSPWDEQVFTASDIGPSIKGKHIDVFTGEGKEAELETFRITGTDHEVCTEP